MYDDIKIFGRVNLIREVCEDRMLIKWREDY